MQAAPRRANTTSSERSVLALCHCIVRESAEQIQRLASALLRKWITTCRNADGARRVREGHVFAKSKKFFKLRELIVDGQALSDPVLWEEPIQQFFGTKWGCTRLQDRWNIMDFLMRWESAPIHFSVDTLCTACNYIVVHVWVGAPTCQRMRLLGCACKCVRAGMRAHCVRMRAATCACAQTRATANQRVLSCDV